jgi:hypothetical protein
LSFSSFPGWFSAYDAIDAPIFSNRTTTYQIFGAQGYKEKMTARLIRQMRAVMAAG